MDVVAISGSTRAGSLNTALLQALQPLAPAGMSIKVVTLNDVPLYDEEIDFAPPEAGGSSTGDMFSPPVPEPICRIRRLVADADGLVFAGPEYNGMMSGALKNIIDWLSRPSHLSPLIGKPAVVMGATESTYHGLSAHVGLTALLRHLACLVLEPDYILKTAHKRLVYDEDGVVRITDTWQSDLIALLLRLLRESIERSSGDIMTLALNSVMEEAYLPRRREKVFPLRVRTMTHEQIEAARVRDPWH
jgi:chromate reductase